MTGPFGTTPGEWLRSGNLVYALDERGTANRFSVRVEGGYEINFRRDPVRTDDAEVKSNARAIAQVPAMLELVAAMNEGGFEPVKWVEMARAISRKLEEKQ